MKRQSLTWVLALSLLLGGLGLAQTSRAADEGAKPAATSDSAPKHSSKKHHRHSKKKSGAEATQAGAEQPAK